jgi:hypothetical protein
MADWLYDRQGQAVAILDGDTIRDRRGTVAAWVTPPNVHSLYGHHIGWFEAGVIYDRYNRCIFFTANATGPMSSRPGLAGAPGMPGFAGAPGKPGLAGAPGRPGYSGSWSQLSFEEFVMKAKLRPN